VQGAWSQGDSACGWEQGLEAASWPDAFEAIKKGLEGAKRNEIAAIAGKLADAESMVALKVCQTFNPNTESGLALNQELFREKRLFFGIPLWSRQSWTPLFLYNL